LEWKGAIDMNAFPEFMRNAANRIASSEQATPGVEGYVFEGADGSQMTIWTCHETAASAEHTHDFDEYMVVVQGRYTLVIGGKEIALGAGAEHFIPRGTAHSGWVVGGTRTIHAFGGRRVNRADRQPEPVSQNPTAAGGVTRIERLMIITRRLIILTCSGLAAVVALFGLTLYFGQHFMVSWACFGCGLLGGFVSIQQRLKRLGDEELELLSRSRFQVLLIPLYGAIFALVLYFAFLSDLVQSPLFPHFAIAAFSQSPSTQEVANFLGHTYPASGPDLTKLLFWSFVAGFSERFVPQILDTVQSRREGEESGAKA
jgi:mannose-6-phosphate isomerase-like protein (cupin superfamily)